MRLLSVHTYQLETFEGRERPDYAILSHTWTNDEIIFGDIQGFSSSQNWQPRPGASKILNAAKLAAENGLHYIWIDTCCIDKSSSAELSEAINSMYKWYQEATVCYVYLGDVNEDTEYEITTSRWFCRGWTLQELLAPQAAEFYNKSWQLVGTRETLAELIHKTTDIDIAILQKPFENGPTGPPVHEKMLWASKRETSREEDMAYCLLGVFDVNMPLLYGEGGEKAFRRLQEDIVRRTTDHSILLHETMDHVLASKPQDFRLGFRVFKDTYRHKSMHQFDILKEGCVVNTLICPLQAVDGGKTQEHVFLVILDTYLEQNEPPVVRAAFIVLYEDGRYYRRTHAVYRISPSNPKRATLWYPLGEPAGRRAQYVDIDLSQCRRSSIHLVRGEPPSAYKRIKSFRSSFPFLLTPILQPVSSHYGYTAIDCTIVDSVLYPDPGGPASPAAKLVWLIDKKLPVTNNENPRSPLVLIVLRQWVYYLPLKDGNDGISVTLLDFDDLGIDANSVRDHQLPSSDKIRKRIVECMQCEKLPWRRTDTLTTYNGETISVTVENTVVLENEVLTVCVEIRREETI